MQGLKKYLKMVRIQAQDMISLLHYQNETNNEPSSPFSPNVIKMKKSIDL